MKKSIKYMIATAVLAAAAALSFGPAASAQESAATVRYDKKISPTPDANGFYTINLEAFVTGKITMETSAKPADIVLVLDYSHSMETKMSNAWNAGDDTRRINRLRSAVAGFVNIVQKSNSGIEEQYKDDPDGDGVKDGHRIAFVLYSGPYDEDNPSDAVYEAGKRMGRSNRITVPSGISLNKFLNVEKLTTEDEYWTGYQYHAATVKYSGDASNNDGLLSPGTSGGTYSGAAMTRTNALLDSQTYVKDEKGNDKRSRVVVFFTDGEPGYGGSWTEGSRKEQADECIDSANTIKTAEDYAATVYAIGLFNAKSTADQVTTFLNYTSSDATAKTSMPTSGPWVNVDKYSAIVDNEEALSNVFTDIASSSADTYSAASSSSVLVDIVATNFHIPENTDLAKVKVYQVACTQTDPKELITFSDVREPLTLVDADGNPGLVQNGAEVTVTGFDYGAEWCGVEQYSDGGVIKNRPHGHKLVLEIPISVNDDVVGGPSVDTNAPGSKLVIKDSEGNTISEHAFISPVVKIPVTIWIKKEGLRDPATNDRNYDSAIFTLRRTKFLGRYETDADGHPIMEGETPKLIDYIYIKGEDPLRKYTVNGVETEMKWETFTKLAVNYKTNPDGIVKISGLDPDYVYRIEEDAWAHLGYEFDPNATAQYTLVWDPATGTYKDIQNPFTFSNDPKGNVYAEDVVRNVFGQGSGTGQGIITTGSGSDAGSK